MSAERPDGENRIRLLLLDDEALLRTSLAHFLASEPGLQVVGDCGTPQETLQLLNTSPVDVVLVDFVHALEDRGALIAAAVRNGYLGRFLIVAESTALKHCAIAITLGASGVFPKSEPPDRLVEAITVIAYGGVWLEPSIRRLVADEPMGRLPGRMTGNERTVLLGILSGLSNRRIAEDFGLSERSVKTAVQQLFYRAGVRSRGELMRMISEGFLEPPSFVRAAPSGQSKD